MEVKLTRQADKEYNNLPQQLQRQVDKQLAFLAGNIRHPSLEAKKYGGADDVWQARVNKSHRFYFKTIDGTYRILTIIPHPK